MVKRGGVVVKVLDWGLAKEVAQWVIQGGSQGELPGDKLRGSCKSNWGIGGGRGGRGPGY